MIALKPTVLLVDNDDGLLSALAIRLQTAGMRCISAHSGTQALAEMKHLDVDLLITDLNMPCGDGVSLVETFRRICNAPVIVITGFSAQLNEDWLAEQAATVIEKPFESGELVRAASVMLHTPVNRNEKCIEPKCTLGIHGVDGEIV